MRELIQELISQEYVHARNNGIHAENLATAIDKEIRDAWTDIALYANMCGLRGKEYMRFCEYGFRRIGGKPNEDEYLILKEIGKNV